MGLLIGIARWTIRLTMVLAILLGLAKGIGGLWQRPMLMWVDGVSLGSMDLIMDRTLLEPLPLLEENQLIGSAWSADGRWLAMVRAGRNPHQAFEIEIIDLYTPNVVCESVSTYEPPEVNNYRYPHWRDGELWVQATFGTQQTNLYRIAPITCTLWRFDLKLA